MYVKLRICKKKKFKNFDKWVLISNYPLAISP
jgi:hypothetical protein